MDVNEELLAALLRVAAEVESLVAGLGPVPKA